MSDARSAPPADLRRRLAMLEAEASSLREALFASSEGEALPGTYLVVEAGGVAGCVLSSVVEEIIPLVACTPLPDSPPHVMGSFSYRGKATLAIDLASLFGKPRLPPVDAHVLVLAGAQPVAVVTDRVRALIEAPVIAADSPGANGSTAANVSRLVAGFCRHNGELLPVLRIEALEASAGATP